MDNSNVIREEIKYEVVYEYGDEILREKLLNYDVFTESNLFKLEFPYILGKEFKDKGDTISYMMYDTNEEILYLLDNENNQFRYNVQEHVICKNDMPVSVRSVFIPVKKKAFNVK